jgi:hypothetical protein
MAHQKKQPQAKPVTPPKQKQDTPITELNDTALEQVVGGLASGIPNEGMTPDKQANILQKTGE